MIMNHVCMMILRALEELEKENGKRGFTANEISQKIKELGKEYTHQKISNVIRTRLTHLVVVEGKGKHQRKYYLRNSVHKQKLKREKKKEFPEIKNTKPNNNKQCDSAWLCWLYYEAGMMNSLQKLVYETCIFRKTNHTAFRLPRKCYVVGNIIHA